MPSAALATRRTGMAAGRLMSAPICRGGTWDRRCQAEHWLNYGRRWNRQWGGRGSIYLLVMEVERARRKKRRTWGPRESGERLSSRGRREIDEQINATVVMANGNGGVGVVVVVDGWCLIG